ncbi:GNAT family N-acetyltransferase [uncultured Croceitalea sp.]|uniref:GNAT family N-acetyltransferase n=1 Tax=uncultured Croceitalea sp. TaxID=1798908 RepID=UPI0033065362
MISLRPATLKDLELLEYWDTQAHVIAGDPDDDWDWKKELAVDPPWREQLIAELDGQAIGCIQIIDPVEEETHYWGEVPKNLRALDIWIGEAYHLNKGYGTQMMKQAIARCFSHPEVEKILIDPLKNNVKAHRFYERLGFKFVEERNFNGTACFVYELERAATYLLSTERLVVTEVSLKDDTFILELVNSPNWIAFIGDRGIRTLEDAQKYIRESLRNSYQKYGFGLYKMSLKSNNAPIGICGFLKRDYLDYPDIGFATLPAYEGKGYTYEVAKATMIYGANNLNLKSILAITTEANTKSKNLLTKLGLVLKDTILDDAKKALLVYTNSP